MPKSYKTLLTIFRKLGADDPEGWAVSEAEDGIPQLSRFILIKKAWEQCIIAD